VEGVELADAGQVVVLHAQVVLAVFKLLELLGADVAAKASGMKHFNKMKLQFWVLQSSHKQQHTYTAVVE
jgi:hypothetical protein